MEDRKPKSAAEAFGMAVGVIVVGLIGLLVVSGLVWCIAAIWRAI